MSKTKLKPGIHLRKRVVYIPELKKNKSWFWWQIVSKNGRIIARSSETYTRKAGAIKSMKVAELIFVEASTYHDHSKPDSPLTIIP
jgi:uncharacterized protein YegP (UPF0339 family)